MDFKQKVLVTGGNGLLGRLAVAALTFEHDVHALVHSFPRNPIDNVHYHVLDLSTSWDIDILPSSIDTIIHLAQSGHFREFPEKALDVFRVNIDSTARLLDYARKNGVKRFIYASSGGIYGAGSQPFHENSPISPYGSLGYYLGSKLCGEVLVGNYAQYMIVVILRFFFLYGAGQKRFMLIPRLFDCVREGRPVLLQGKNGIRITPTHVCDARDALIQCIHFQESRTLNISGPEVLTIREIADIMGECLHKRPVFESKPGKPEDYVANIESMKQLLGAPRIHFKEGIRSLI